MTLVERRVPLMPQQVLALRVERRRRGDVVRAVVELERGPGFVGETSSFDLPLGRLRAVARALEELAAELEAHPDGRMVG